MSDSQGLGLGFAVGDDSIFGAGQLADAFGIVKMLINQVASCNVGIWLLMQQELIALVRITSLINGSVEKM